MQQLALDIRTLSFITTSIAFLYAIGLFVFGRMKKKFKGFGALASGSAFYGMGLFLLGFRDVLPDIITIVIANTLLVAGLVLYFEGSRRFLGVADSIHPAGIVAILSNMGIFLYYTFQNPSVNMRIITICIIATILSGLCSREFSRNMPNYWRVPATLIALVFGSYCAFQLYRISWTLGEGGINSLMSAGTVHSFAFIFIIILITGSAFGFIWMVSKQLEYELTELANQDQLTKILNRRGVETLAKHEFLKMARLDTNLSIILTDIDHFKQVNDRFGHPRGDGVLVGFAKTIQENLRPFDIFGRIGGEEFVIIMPNTTLDEAAILAERLRKVVEAFVFDVKNKKIKITASFGVVNYVSEADTLDRLMTYADKALYHSKQRGRNQVTHFSPKDMAAKEILS